MYIKSYKCSRFAGLRNIDLEFTKGLNVILGPNESGKSTIINGIHSTLFKDISIKRNNNTDKEFEYRFFPKPEGDFIDGEVILETEKGTFEIIKEWGSSKSIELTTPDGSILKSEKKAQDELKDILKFGESTYNNIVFAKQRDLKNVLDNIMKDNELSREINDLLRMTLMELDGVSINSIQKKIEDELDRLYKRWDKEKNHPEGNRGVNNPYKVGLGKILEKYYDKEILRQSMEESEKAEIDFEDISERLMKTENIFNSIKEEKEFLEDIEVDINSRENLELREQNYYDIEKRLRKINTEWPTKVQEIKHLIEKLENLRLEELKINEEKDNIIKSKKRNELSLVLEQVEKLQEKICQLRLELEEIPVITNEDIKELEQLNKEIYTCETKMKAGKILGKIKSLTDKSIVITKDFEEEQKLADESSFEANGYIKINYGNEFEIEIKNLDIDFEELRKEYEKFKNQFSEKLKSLKIESIDNGKVNLSNIKYYENEISKQEEQLEYILGEKTVEEIKLEIKEIGELQNYRDIEKIDEDLKEINDNKIKFNTSKLTEEREIDSWEVEFIDHESLLDKIIYNKTKLKEVKEEIDKLKPLPEKFDNIGEFKDRLLYLKEEYRLKEQELNNLKDDYYDAKLKLPDETYEELRGQYLQADFEFEKYKSRGEKVSKIKDIFLSTKNKMAQNPMESLVTEFVKYLEIITNGKYSVGDIYEDLNITLEGSSGIIPIDLLSAGTYDSVALALRFSLVKHIFKDQQGYLILDDCLVDLDYERKLQAIELIKEFAKDYQVIFSTCDNNTAEMLSGNLIKID